MKNITKLMIILLIIGSCATLDREVGNGIEETKTIELTSFDGISYDLSHDLVVKQGDLNEAKLIGDSNILDNVEFEIRNGVLYIDLMPGSYINISLKVEVTLKALKLIENTGSGDIHVESRTDSNDKLTLITDGSGNINLMPQYHLTEINVTVDGSGNVTFDGETSVSRVNITTDSSEDMNAYSLSTQFCEILADGSGDVHLTVMEELVGTIEGDGNIYYKGTPHIEMIYKDSGVLINKN